MLDRLRNFLRSFDADRALSDRRAMIDQLEEEAFHLSVEIAALTACQTRIAARLKQLRADVQQIPEVTA